MKRTNKITVNLTDEEMQFISRLAEVGERKISELARLLLMRQALNEWGKMQPQGEPFRPLSLD
jgi:hypothetical protein